MNYTLFACGPGAGLMLVIYGVLALWVVSGGFFVANLCLLFALRDGPLLRNASGLLLYTAAGLSAYNHINSGSLSDPEPLLFTSALGFPALIIAHFVWLVRLVRRERRVLRDGASPS